MSHTLRNSMKSLCKYAVSQTFFFRRKLKPVSSFASPRLRLTTQVLATASNNLNKLTGYTIVENLKEEVIQREKEFETARKCLATAKRAYEEIISGRSAIQREINELLQRKHQWSGDDVIRFTQLYKNEHTNEQIESAAREEFQKCEQKVEQGYTELTRSIMLRYHEEQIWSDKIRSASTYGTVALMMLNVISFIGVQTFFEPRKRQKLADKFEELLIQRTNEEGSKSETGIVHTFMKQRFENLEGKVDELTQSLTPIFNQLSDYVVGDVELGNDDSIDPKLSTTQKELKLPMREIEKSASVQLSQSEIDRHIFMSAFLGASVGWLISFMMTEWFR